MELVTDKFKMTEVGLIPSDWEVKLLKDVAHFSNGKAHERLIDDNGDYIVINSKFISTEGEIFKNSSIALSPLSKGDITMVMSDIPNGKALAKCFIVDADGRYTLNQRICSLKTDKCDSIFLFWILNRNDYFLAFDSGTGQTNLKRQEVLDCPLALPPTKAEQTAIATALSDADNYISSLEKLIAKKRLLKQGAMQQLLSPKEGWVVKKLNKLVWYQEGPGVRNHQFKSSGVKLLNGTNIENGKLLLEKTDRYISESEANGWYSHFLVDDGDILIACSGISVDRFDEKVTIAEKHHLPLCMNTSTMRFKIISDDITKQFFFHFLKSKSFKEQIGGKATGSAQLNFGPSHVHNVDIEYPNTEEQTHIATILSDMDAGIAALEKQLAKARSIKQAMMQQLLTGKIRLV